MDSTSGASWREEDRREALALEAEIHRRRRGARRTAGRMTVERLVELVIRSFTAEHEIADVHRGHSSYVDRVPLVVVDRDNRRWRLPVMVEPHVWWNEAHLSSR